MNDDSGIMNPQTKTRETIDKWNSNKGRWANPDLLKRDIAIRRAKQEAAFRDPQAYIKKLFNRPKAGGATINIVCRGIEAASRRLGNDLITGEINMPIKDYLAVLENLRKTVAFLDDLNSEAAGKAIKQTVIGKMTINNNSSRTGGAIGNILDVEVEDGTARVIS